MVHWGGPSCENEWGVHRNEENMLGWRIKHWLVYPESGRDPVPVFSKPEVQSVHKRNRDKVDEEGRIKIEKEETVDGGGNGGKENKGEGKEKNNNVDPMAETEQGRNVEQPGKTEAGHPDALAKEGSGSKKHEVEKEDIAKEAQEGSGSDTDEFENEGSVKNDKDVSGSKTDAMEKDGSVEKIKGLVEESAQMMIETISELIDCEKSPSRTPDPKQEEDEIQPKCSDRNAVVFKDDSNSGEIMSDVGTAGRKRRWSSRSSGRESTKEEEPTKSTSRRSTRKAPRKLGSLQQHSSLQLVSEESEEDEKHEKGSNRELCDEEYKEKGDKPEWTEEMSSGRNQRWAKRAALAKESVPLYQLSGNAEVAEEFSTTMRKSLGEGTVKQYATNLFSRSDDKSLLKFLTDTYGPEFRATMLTAFGQVQGWICVPTVEDWVSFAFPGKADVDASQQAALMKSFKAFLSYIKKKMMAAAAKSSTPNEVNLANHRRILVEQVADSPTEAKMWKDVKERIARQQTKVEVSKKVMAPDLEATIVGVIKSYNSSDVFKAKMDEVMEIHTRCDREDVKPTPKEFDKVATLVHGQISIGNAGRASLAGSIKNVEFYGRRMVAAGEDFSVVEGDKKEVIGSVVTVTADEERHHKTGNTQLVFISSCNMSLMMVYEDVRAAFFKNTEYAEDVEDGESPLFISADRKAIKKPRASFMNDVGEVSGINVTSNTVRQSGTTQMLGNKDIADIEAPVMDHSVSTAKKHYDKSSAKNAVKAKKFLSDVNADKPLPIDPLLNNEFLKAKRAERKERCRQVAVELAALNIEESKKHQRQKQKAHGAQCTLTSDEKDTLVEILTSQPDKATSKLFCPPNRIPKEREFAAPFYRLLDSGDLEEDARKKLGEIEEGVFKSEVATRSTWPEEPSAKENMLADKKIGAAIWRSLHSKYKTEWKFQPAPPIIVSKPRI